MIKPILIIYNSEPILSILSFSFVFHSGLILELIKYTHNAMKIIDTKNMDLHPKCSTRKPLITGDAEVPK